VPVLSGKADTVSRKDAIYWERGGNLAVRWGKWKLVQLANTPRKYELYDLSADRAENKDLSKLHPAVVEQLKHLYNEWALKNDVVDYSRLRPQGNLGGGERRL
jgi:arylsulfatase